MDMYAALATRRTVIIGVVGFLTLVDLFAAQAILPSLAAAYAVPPGAIGVAVNASTIGMAVACLAITFVSRYLDRRTGIWVSLALLAVPTTLLAFAADLQVFTALRVLQCVFMATAFTLTMAYLAEHLNARDTAKALSAYITGVVASNLVGRLLAGSVVDMYGLAINFYLFAGLNLFGAAIVLFNLDRMSALASPMPATSPITAWRVNLSNPAMLCAFGIGFLILFAFIGTFTYVNFVLAGPEIGVSQMSLGFVYLVFLPSMLTTPFAGSTAVRFGARRTVVAGLLLAGLGLPAMLVANLAVVLVGMVLVGVGTFFAQAVATGFVGREATTDRAAASALYLASYYTGGLAGAAVLGQLFDRLGWGACIAGIAMSLVLASLLAIGLQSNAGVREALRPAS